MRSDPFLWFVAGEESGDARAFEVMEAIRQIHPGIRFGGAGGSRMQSLCAAPFDPWIQRAAVDSPARFAMEATPGKSFTTSVLKSGHGTAPAFRKWPAFSI
jgi:hypothetical protein